MVAIELTLHATRGAIIHAAKSALEASGERMLGELRRIGATNQVISECRVVYFVCSSLDGRLVETPTDHVWRADYELVFFEGMGMYETFFMISDDMFAWGESPYSKTFTVTMEGVPKERIFCLCLTRKAFSRLRAEHALLVER
jgi:hypothetical protein